MKARLTFGPYEPDKPPHMTDGLLAVKNAYPGTKGWRPVGAFSALTPALDEDFQGGASFVATDGTASLIAGTASDLYTFTGGAWTSVLDTLGLPATARWRFTQFGDVAVCVNGAQTQQIDLVTGVATDLTDAPNGTLVTTVRDFVVIGQADNDMQMVKWSGFNDHEEWTPDTNQSGFQPMLSGGAVMGLAGGEYGLILQRNAIKRMSYTGDEFVFQFDEIASNVGCISSGSVAQAGRLVFFLSDRGFMICDGSDVKPIGIERVDATFLSLYDRADLAKMYASIDPRAHLVAWMMPGSPGRIWVYNWSLDRWGIIETGIRGLFDGFTANVALEDLDTLYPSGLDDIPYSLDDPIFAGGDPRLFVVSPTNEVGSLTGANLAALFQLPFVELIPGQRARSRVVRPVCDAIDRLTVKLDTRQRLGDPAAVVSYSTLRTSGDMPVRQNGRFTGITMEIGAGIPWTYAQGIQIECEAGGSR